MNVSLLERCGRRARRHRRVPGILLFALLVAGFSLHAAEPIDRIVAVVDDDVLMQSEFDRFKERISQQLAQRGTELPPSEIFERQVLERLIMQKIQLQAARRAGVTVDDDTLNKAIANIAAQNRMTLAQFRGALENEGLDFGRFRDDIREEIMVVRLKQREVDNRITVSDREIDNYLQNPQNQGAAGENEYRLSHILVATPEGATPEQIAAAQEKAEQTLADLRVGVDFHKTAVAVSDGQQALDGGDVGWRTAGQVPALFADALRNMKVGDISDIIRGPNGFHIIKLTDARTQEAHIVTQTHARHILVKASEVVSQEDVRGKLEQLKTRIEGGDDFAQLARSHSEDRATASKGGDLGWVSPGELDPDFERAAGGLLPNQVSEPFQSQFGWHIVQVLERREHDDSAEAMRGRARDAIRQRKMEEETQAWSRRLRDEAYVEYRLPGVAVSARESGSKGEAELSEQPSPEAESTPQ
ncbi:MAG: peptidylprolyl isomerase [Chromatiales bacterium]